MLATKGVQFPQRCQLRLDQLLFFPALQLKLCQKRRSVVQEHFSLCLRQHPATACAKPLKPSCVALAITLCKAIRTKNNQFASIFNDMNSGVDPMTTPRLLTTYPVYWIDRDYCE